LEYLTIVPVLLLSVIIHEISHGVMAYKLGDPTAKEMGRLTLNPIPHIDLLGSILVPLASYIMSGTVFLAWAKPVPVNPENFQHRRRDDILVSIVGPVSNLIVALACVFGYVALSRLVPMDSMPEGAGQKAAFFFSDMMLAGISLNIYLAVFNMIPVPPLDGSHVLASLLPERLRQQYQKIGFAGVLVIVLAMRIPAVQNTVLSVVHQILVPYQLLIDSMSR
jgi:Zn-dependent protease